MDRVGALLNAPTQIDVVRDSPKVGLATVTVQATLTDTTSPRVSSLTGTVFTAALPSATQLSISAQPRTSVAAGAGFGFVVQAKDAFGNVDPNFHGNVTVAAVHGVATFTGLKLNKAGAGHTLKLISAGFATLTTRTFSVTPAAAAKLVVKVQPPSRVGLNKGFAFTVQALDAFGNIDTNFNKSVTVMLAANPGRATLSGKVTVTAHKGVAAFAALKLNCKAAGYKLKAASGKLAAAITKAPSAT